MVGRISSINSQVGCKFSCDLKLKNKHMQRKSGNHATLNCWGRDNQFQEIFLKPLPRLLHGYNLKNIPKEEPSLLNDMRIISPNLSKGISNVQLRTPKVLKSNGPSPDGIFPGPKRPALLNGESQGGIHPKNE